MTCSSLPSSPFFAHLSLRPFRRRRANTACQNVSSWFFGATPSKGLLSLSLIIFIHDPVSFLGVAPTFIKTQQCTTFGTEGVAVPAAAETGIFDPEFGHHKNVVDCPHLLVCVILENSLASSTLSTSTQKPASLLLISPSPFELQKPMISNCHIEGTFGYAALTPAPHLLETSPPSARLHLLQWLALMPLQHRRLPDD